MPSSSEHREKVGQNQAFLDSINVSAAAEWAATVAFYVAVHLIERLCSLDNIHNGSHHDRFAFLLKHKKHRAIHGSCSALFDASQIARYGTVNQFRKAFHPDQVESELIGQHLAAIENYLEAQFRPKDSGEGAT